MGEPQYPVTTSGSNLWRRIYSCGIESPLKTAQQRRRKILDGGFMGVVFLEYGLIYDFLGMILFSFLVFWGYVCRRKKNAIFFTMMRWAIVPKRLYYIH